MLTTYRRVLGLPGAFAFSASGLLGRLPISMVSLGIVLLISVETGSYAVAGAVSASYLVANAAFALLQGRLVDRFGQSVVLPPAILLFTVSLSLMMVAVQEGWPTPAPHLLAAVAGASLPQVGSCVRARWSHLVRDPHELHTAFSLEAVADEAVFILGPTLVTLLATGVHPVAGLVAALLTGAVGTLALAAQRRTEPPASRHTRATGPRPSMPWGRLAPLVVASAAIGALFGGSEVATVAFADELGSPAAAGPLLAVWATGSLLSGVITGAVTWRTDTAARFRAGALLLGVSLLPMPFLEGLVPMGLVLFVAGFAISPTLIALMALVEQTVPASRLTEGMALIHTGMAAGIAPGAALAGIAIDARGASFSYWVPVVAGVLGALAALAARSAVRSSNLSS